MSHGHGQLYLPQSHAHLGHDLMLSPAHRGVPVVVEGKSFVVFGVPENQRQTVASLLSETPGVEYRFDVRHR